MSMSDEILQDYAKNPKINYYASNVQDMAKEILALREQLKEKAELERLVGERVGRLGK